MTYTWERLTKLTDEELVAEHDRKAASTEVGLDFLYRELSRRDQDRQTREMLGYTRQMTILTVVVTVATVLNLVATAILLFK